MVGDDLAATGTEALEEAIALAGRVEGAEVHVLHALSRPSAKRLADNDRRLEAALAALKSRVARALVRDPSVKAHAHVRFGKIVDTLVEVAVAYDAAMILVGTHGRQGADRVRPRSVAERLVRTAPLPVLVAHARDYALLPTGARPSRAPLPHHDGSARALTELVVAPEEPPR